MADTSIHLPERAYPLLRVIFLMLATCVLTGCMTAYQPRGATGGYVDRKVDENTFHVSFFGNGNTPKERVFRFWLHRCAELTVQNSFDFFTILGPRSQADTGAITPATTAADQEPFPFKDIEQMRTVSSVPSYIYIPGGTIRTWSASGYIRMYKGTADPDDDLSFGAKQVLADLGPETREGSNVSAIPGKSYDPGRVFKPSDPDMAIRQTPDGRPKSTGVGPDMSDLKGLLPDAEQEK